MAGPVIESQIQDGGFRLPPQRRTWPSSLDCFSPPSQGLAANPSGYGPLTELPDWSYADGRPAPPMKGQLRRQAQREKFARRVVLLSQEMDAGLQAWQLRQQEKLQEEERKQKNALKPKGAALQSPQPKQKGLDSRKNRL
nr:PREDICTED: 39S ribosomal protein L52, mitochondrial [Equus przewalskii]